MTTLNLIAEHRADIAACLEAASSATRYALAYATGNHSGDFVRGCVERGKVACRRQLEAAKHHRLMATHFGHRLP